jgi:hypothetical protein
MVIFTAERAENTRRAAEKKNFSCGSATLRISAVTALTVISPQSALSYAEGRREDLLRKTAYLRRRDRRSKAEKVSVLRARIVFQ